MHLSRCSFILTNLIVSDIQSEDTLFYRSAVAYVKKLGWPVFALNPKEKTPIFRGGFYTATKDINKINKWWRDNPKANIGIPTGKASGFIAIDIDIRHNGDESLRELEKQYGKLPDTVEALTGSGGKHLLFRNPGQVFNRANIKSGIDVRGEGGYIVVAPSVHPSGDKYMWELSSRPHETELAECPGWLLNIIQNDKQYERKPSNHWLDILHGVREGNRNNAATQLAGHLFRKYVDPKVVLEILKMWNESRVFPPLSPHELYTIVNSIAGKELSRREGKKFG